MNTLSKPRLVDGRDTTITTFVFADLPVVEYLTFMVVMERADIHLYL